MHNHLDQAKHNERFLTEVERSFPLIYNDWKITIVFYAALHYLRAYASFRGVIIPESHDGMRRAMGSGQPSGPKLDIDESCSKSYRVLFSICHSARYQGVKDMGRFEAMHGRGLVAARKKLDRIKGHLKEKGLKVA